MILNVLFFGGEGSGICFMFFEWFSDKHVGVMLLSLLQCFFMLPGSCGIGGRHPRQERVNDTKHQNP